MLSLYTNLATRLHRNEKGATAVEYGIMVALIAVVVIGAVTLLGGGMAEAFDQAQCAVNGDTWTKASAAGVTPVVEAKCTPK